MDKTKISSVIGIVVLVIICIGLLGYAANINAQLGIERSRIAMLNSEILNLQKQLSGAISKADAQKALIDSLQASLNNLNIEASNLKALNADLEVKLSAQENVTVPQPQVSEPIPAAQ